MSNIAVIKTSLASRDSKMDKYNDLYTIYLKATLDEIEYTDLDISFDDYLSKLVDSSNSAQTSQPSTGEISTLFEELLTKYDKIIAVTPSKHLSGTYQNFILAAQEFEGRVSIVDARNIAMNENVVIHFVYELIKKGMSFDEIVKSTDAFADKLVSYAIPGSLPYLQKSGRVNMSQAVLGKLLNIKIVVKVLNQGADVDYKARGLKKIMSYFEGQIEMHKPTHVVLANIAQDENVRKEMVKFFESKNLIVRETEKESIVAATHFGPLTTGITLYQEEK